MTDREFIELCKQHFAFLGKLSQHQKVRAVPKAGTPEAIANARGKWQSSRKAIELECLKAIEACEKQLAESTP